MALHGFDMALAPIGSEAILMRVWRDMGLTEEEINELFTAPGHLPWMRMGNMSGLDSPLSERWLDEQVALQHRILDRPHINDPAVAAHRCAIPCDPASCFYCRTLSTGCSRCFSGST